MPKEQTLIKIIGILCLCIIISLLYFVFTTRFCNQLVEENEYYKYPIEIIKPALNKRRESEEFNKFIGDYISHHNKVTSNITLALQTKYFIVDPSNNGWGNRFNTMITALLVAMMSGRIWMVGPETHPFWDHFDLPINAHWAKLQALLNTTEQGKQQQLDSISLVEDYPNTKTFLAGNFTESFKQQFVFYTGMDYMGPILERNPHYKDQMRKLFPDGIIYHRIFHAFFHPKSFLLDKVVSFSKANFRKYTLGIQIRTQKVRFIIPSQFCDVAKVLLQQKSLTLESTAVFVATDGREAIWNMLKDCLQPYNITYVPDSDSRTSGGNPGSETGALVDLFLLAKCNDMIITHSSSYGPMAAAIANVIPYSTTLPFNCSNQVQQPVYFFQPFNSEPCMFYCANIVRDFGEPYVGLWKSDGMWLQFCQCHYS